MTPSTHPAFIACLSAFALYACSNETPLATAPDAIASSPHPLSSVATFDASQFQLAEGLVVHGGSAYASFAPLGRIVKIDPNGAVSTYASVPPGYQNGSTLGLVFDVGGNLYVLQAANGPGATAPPGVYKIAPGYAGGMVTVPFATDPNMLYPNGAVVDERGHLLVTDSATGRILDVSPDGLVSTWKLDMELSGEPPCPVPLPFPIGANGIVHTGTEVVVTNTAKGSIVKIAVQGDGSAGAVTTLVKDCQNVGFDGIARSADGSFLVAQNGPNGRLVRVSATGTVTELHTGAPLDGPASIAIAENWNGERMALITNSAFFSVGTDGGAPKPGLLRYGPLVTSH